MTVDILTCVFELQVFCNKKTGEGKCQLDAKELGNCFSLSRKVSLSSILHIYIIRLASVSKLSPVLLDVRLIQPTISIKTAFDSYNELSSRFHGVGTSQWSIVATTHSAPVSICHIFWRTTGVRRVKIKQELETSATKNYALRCIVQFPVCWPPRRHRGRHHGLK